MRVTKAGSLTDAEDSLARALAERNALQLALDESRAREAFLADELQHRVRNLLALVRSLFTRTVDNAPGLEHVEVHFPSRLDTLARYHGRRSIARDPSFDLETMVADELMVFAATNDPRIEIDGPAVALPWRQAEALALALHELATNTIKFGVLADVRGPGRLKIGWTVEHERLAFEWNETGVGVVAAAPITAGFGREYIEQALPYQIDAETSFDIVPGGVHCRIAFPLAPMAGDDGARIESPAR